MTNFSVSFFPLIFAERLNTRTGHLPFIQKGSLIPICVERTTLRLLQQPAPCLKPLLASLLVTSQQQPARKLPISSLIAFVQQLRKIGQK